MDRYLYRFAAFALCVSVVTLVIVLGSLALREKSIPGDVADIIKTLGAHLGFLLATPSLSTNKDNRENK
jgi:hypothetical protein